MCNNTDGKCIAGILTVICILQQNANCADSCLDTCDRGFLGNTATSFIFNTRPIMLYTCCGNGVPWAMPTSRTDTETTSNIFRVEKEDCGCATFRVLAPNSDQTSSFPYIATEDFFTVKLSCIGALR